MGIIPRNYFIAVRHLIRADKVSMKYLRLVLNDKGSYSEVGKRVGQLNAIKARCRKTGLPFDITREDLDWPTHCPILGIKLSRNWIGSSKHSSPSIDRMVPELGYVKGNVRVISLLANGMKSDASREQIEMFCRNILPYMNGEI